MTEREIERERLVELLDIIIQPGQKTLGDIADYLLANGVIVPPCELTKTIYLINSLTKNVLIADVTGFKITEFSQYAVVWLRENRRNTEIPFTAIGKTVFLTKEEAEKALKGGVEE